VRLVAAALVLAGAGATAPVIAYEFPPQLREDMQIFADRVVLKHKLDEDRVRETLLKIQFQQSVIQAVNAPATSKPWKDFRVGLLSRQRIDGGVRYWAANEATLLRARETFGVPEELIVSIIGIETLYGRNMGSYRVLDAVATLAFEVPARSTFFQGELEEFLLLCRDLELDPVALRGSYAGAMGAPQFIPSSYRRYARDFDDDGRVDLWASPADAIGSVANYLKEFGWRWTGEVALRANVTDVQRADELVRLGVRPVHSAAQIEEKGVTPHRPLRDGENAALMLFLGDGGPEYWLGLDNFYVITRYNRSQNYAMAVWQLSQEILLARRKASAAGSGLGK
jgi:membrane-bound lytic murein transglycosylase B